MKSEIMCLHAMQFDEQYLLSCNNGTGGSSNTERYQIYTHSSYDFNVQYKLYVLTYNAVLGNRLKYWD